MIFVTVGSSTLRFGRLVHVAAALTSDEDVVVQCGPVEVTDSRAICVDYLPFADFAHLVREAEVVISHAGIGNVALCLQNGRRPIVVPRRHALGEAADDHQVAFARRLAAENLAICVEDVGQLGTTLDVARNDNNGETHRVASTPLAAELFDYISQHARRIQGALGSERFAQ